jgi:hypothetical protein
MSNEWVTVEITRSAYLEVEADTLEEAREQVDALFDAGDIEGWEEDIPQITIEAITE